MAGFISNSSITAKMVKEGGTAIAVAQNTLSPIIASPSAAVTKSIGSTITGSSGFSANQIQSTVAQAQQTVSNLVNAVTDTTHYLKSAIKSIGDTFTSSPKSLASGISSKFTSTFLDKSLKTASAVITKPSDPISTSLLQSKPPSSTSFKIDSLQSGSQSVGISGSSSTFGSNALSMTGTIKSTLISRFNLDSDKNLPTQQKNSLTSDKLKGLFSFVSDASKTIQQVSNVVRAETNSINNVIYSVKREYAAVSNIVSTAKDTVQSLSSISSINDFQTFLGKTNDLSKSLNNFNFSTYYLVNSVDSLVDQTGAIVHTNGSGVDSNTANSILNIMRQSGCSVSEGYYESASVQASLFNTSVVMASQYGMTNEITQLTNCSFASTALGQKALSNAFTLSAGKQLDAASLVLQSITSPSSLRSNSSLTREIVTNPELKASSLAAVNSIFTTLGTDINKAFSVESVSSPSYPVYDATLLKKSQPAFVKAVFEDDTIGNYFNGQAMVMASDGQFVSSVG